MIKTLRDCALLALFTFAALLIHGFHPFAEDAAIYVPALEKDLNPALFPFGSQFFSSHASMTLFDELVSASIRWTHLPLSAALFGWHMLSIFCLLAGCFLLAKILGGNGWTATALVTAVLTVPVAGTALLLMDPYVTPRSLSTPLVLFAVCAVLKRKPIWAALCLLAVAPIHPLMTVFGAGICLFASLLRGSRVKLRYVFVTGALPIVLVAAAYTRLPAVSPAYHEALSSRGYFFLKNWAWYEIVGLLAPLLILLLVASKTLNDGVRGLAQACILFGATAIVMASILSSSERFEGLAEAQPLRAFHPIYLIFFILLAVEFLPRLLHRDWKRHAAVLVPVACLMFLVQRQTFPADRHVEWPGAASRNPWVQAFEWVRQQTNQSDIVALNPRYMDLAGEDHQGFRAIAERSTIADAAKDAGAVTMFPALAPEWKHETEALHGWDQYASSDYARLRREYGVSWLILDGPVPAGLTCPYRNSSLAVCSSSGL